MKKEEEGEEEKKKKKVIATFIEVNFIFGNINVHKFKVIIC